MALILIVLMTINAHHISEIEFTNLTPIEIPNLGN